MKKKEERMIYSKPEKGEEGDLKKDVKYCWRFYETKRRSLENEKLQ